MSQLSAQIQSNSGPARRLLAALLITIAGSKALAEPTCRSESGPRRNTLIELYTSEGCNSCPPADRWLSSLRGQTGVVALAFHVDYWDYLGWRDRFATPAFSQRQRDKAHTAGARFVYTPQVIVDDRDFTGWRQGRGIPAAPPVTAGASITLDSTPPTAGQVQVRLTAALSSASSVKAVAWLALYENGLVSNIRAGENAGARLTHDFVVRRWLGPIGLESGGKSMSISRTLALTDIAPERAGLAAIVEQQDDGRVLQALNLPLCMHAAR